MGFISLKYTTRLCFSLEMSGQFGVMCHMSRRTLQRWNWLVDTCVLDVYEERILGDGVIFADALPIANIFDAAPDFSGGLPFSCRMT